MGIFRKNSGRDIWGNVGRSEPDVKKDGLDTRGYQL